MKQKKKKKSILILFMGLFLIPGLSGCLIIYPGLIQADGSQLETTQVNDIPIDPAIVPQSSPTSITVPDILESPTFTASPSPTEIPSETPTLTATPTQLPTPTPRAAPFFDQFVEALINGDPTRVVGVYVENVLALKVVLQPANNPAFVSGVKGVATYFSMVRAQTGNTGLLAHNYLAGIYYYDLEPGQIVVLIYGDGRTEEFSVADSQQYQALSPTSPTSSFVNVVTGEKLSSTALFRRVYGGSYKTTFQTCIAQGNEPSWGRLFVIAPQD